MWERRSYNDGVSSRCTVKFRGRIPEWPNSIALGVEWDDSSRGRNNGALHGKQYFECRVPGSGSFIKDTRPYEEPQSFENALASKYLQTHNFDSIQLSKGKKAELARFEKVDRQQKNLEGMESISVAACRVNCFENNLNELNLRSLRRLDLSDNLISDFELLVSAICEFKHLTALRLNGNRFNFENMCLNTNIKCQQLQELDMAYTMINASEVEIAVSNFPNLKQLGLAGNQLQEIPCGLPPGLACLDLANNPISDLSRLPSTLEKVFLSGTKITGIKETDRIPPSIDLTDTKVFSWESVTELGRQGVIDLQLFQASDSLKSKQYRPFIIARCPTLTKLDGTAVTTTERTDAELYTLNAVMSKKHPPLPPSLWKALTGIHGEPTIPPEKSIRQRLIWFYIDGESEVLRIVRDAPLNRLQWLVASRKGCSPRDFRIKGITDIETAENDLYSSITEVGDLISNGQVLITESK